MTATKRFETTNLNIDRLIEALRAWATAQNMESQRLRLETGAIVIQCVPRKGDLRQWIGADMATTIELFHESNGALHVTVANGRWINVKRGVIGVVALSTLWPLAVPAGVGLWKQSRLSDAVFKVVAAAVRVA